MDSSVMTMEEIRNVGLPKWPAFVVLGKPVSKNRAKEIIMRTTELVWFVSNDEEFENQIYEYLGFEGEKAKFLPSIFSNYETVAARIEKEIKPVFYKDPFYGDADLEYCANHRVISAWIGGAHGWIDWDGNVGCNNYNIGKWPKTEEIFKEWQAIATAFPDIELRCQLFNHEVNEEPSEGNSLPLIEFNVKNSKVQAIKPTEIIAKPTFDVEVMLGEILNPLNNTRERGCTFEQFVDAYEHTKKVNQFQ